MTARELHTLVQPLIGTGCEPKKLKCDVDWMEWEYAGCDCIPWFPVEAAAAMWEASIMDWLCKVTGRDVTFVRFAHRVERWTISCDAFEGEGPTRLHALIAAAVKVGGGKT